MRKKISIIGGGQIGGVLTQLIALKELADVALVDINEGIPQGKVLDIYEASKIDAVDVNMIGSTDYSIIKNSDIVIVTAGVPRKPGMSRDDLLVVNSNIMKVVATNIKEFAPDSIVIVISNPLDAMVTLCQKITGFKHNKVIGQAGVLDSSRFASFIAWELNVSVKDINSIVLGGHGDTMVPLVRYANVNGIPVTDMLNKKYGKEKAIEVMAKIVQRTRDAGGEVVALLKTGSAFYSPAAAAIQMVEAILKNERRILPIAAYLNGEYNISGFYMGVPVILGENGAESVLEVELNEEERVMFDNSLNAVKKNVEDLTRLGF